MLSRPAWFAAWEPRIAEAAADGNGATAGAIDRGSAGRSDIKVSAVPPDAVIDGDGAEAVVFHDEIGGIDQLQVVDAERSADRTVKNSTISLPAMDVRSTVPVDDARIARVTN
jgi:hypothetical protein